MPRFPLILPLLALPLLSACQSGPPPGSTKPTVTELRARIVDTTAYGAGSNGYGFKSYYAPDGTLRITSGSFADTGTYRIEDDGRVCLKFTTIRNGVDTCMTVWISGTREYSFFPNGTLSGIVDIRKPGNPERL